MERDAALQAQERAVAVPLEDRLCSQAGCSAVEHQQLPVQEPADAAHVRLVCFRGNVQQEPLTANTQQQRITGSI